MAPTSWSPTSQVFSTDPNSTRTRTEGEGMIKQAAYGVEPWSLKESGLNMDLLAQSESVFALSNGHIGLRGNLDEGEPHGLPGTYLNSFFEQRPLPYAEAGYGYPESGQTVINVTNGKLIRLLVDDEPFDIRYGTLNSHDRVLALRAGTLTRHADWTSPAGSRVRVTSTRLVSLTQRAIAAISYTGEAVEGQCRLGIQSAVVANEQVPHRGRGPGAAWYHSRVGPQTSTPPTAAGIRARRPPWTPRWSARSSTPTTTASAGRSWSPAPGSAGCGWRPGCCTRSRARSGCRCTPRPTPTWAGR